MNISNLVRDVKTIMAEAKPPITVGCCIYRVPCDIREVNIDAYTPKFISIGPLHHYDKILQEMEKYKQVYFKRFVVRSKTKLENLISSVVEVEPKRQRCYSDLVMSTNDLVKVILVDACFIVELFYVTYHEEWTDDDNILLKPSLLFNISLDLLLLENQTPFFILEKLYNLAFSSHIYRSLHSFLELSSHFFVYFKRQELKKIFTICHFTDLLRTFHLQKQELGRGRSYDKQIPTASAFQDAGLKFKKNESKCMLEMQFSKGCLRIPEIGVVDSTEMLFRNMVAFEQCHYPYNGYITDYVSVMCLLINTGKDVDVLVENGILLTWLSDNDVVAKMFKILGKNIFISNFDVQYIDNFEQLDLFYKDQCRQKRATLKRDYCNTTWTTLATCAGIAILFLTLIQTVCSILEVV